MSTYIETYTIITKTFIYLDGKNAFFISIMETGLSGSIASHFSRESSNFLVGVSILLTSFDSISVENLLKFSTVYVSPVINILSAITFLGNLSLLHLPLPGMYKSTVKHRKS